MSNKTLHVCREVDDDDDDEWQAESYVDRLYEEFSDLVIHIEPDKWEIPDSMISDEQKNAQILGANVTKNFRNTKILFDIVSANNSIVHYRNNGASTRS